MFKLINLSGLQENKNQIKFNISRSYCKNKENKKKKRNQLKHQRQHQQITKNSTLGEKKLRNIVNCYHVL